MKSMIPVVMAGVIGIYGLIVAVIIVGVSLQKPSAFCAWFTGNSVVARAAARAAGSGAIWWPFLTLFEHVLVHFRLSFGRHRSRISAWHRSRCR